MLGDAGGWTALVGIPLAAQPGTARISVRPADGGAARDVAYTIAPKRYREQQLKVAPGHVDLSPEDQARHQRERVHLAAVMATFSEPPPPGDAHARAGAGPALSRPSACAACSTARPAIRTAAWTSRPAPAPRWWRRWPGA